MKKMASCCVALWLALAPGAPAQSIAVQQGTVGGIPGSVPFPAGQSAAPGGIITGSVVDENGTPIANAVVQCSREMTMPDGVRRQVGGSASRPTDASGRFTLERLQPGDYTLAVIRFGPLPYGSVPQDSSAITYFPGVTDVSQAQPVAAVEGGGQPIVIRVRRTRGFHVRGTVSAESHRSAAGLNVQVMQTVFTSSFSRASATVQPDGSFDITPLAPGTYNVFIRVGSGDVFAATQVKVTDGDINDVRLNLISGGTIHGRLVLKNPPKGPAPLGLSVQAGTNIPTASTSQSISPIGRAQTGVAVSADWTFEIKGLYGRYRFTLQMTGLPDYAVVRTVLDKQDIGSSLDVPITEGVHDLVFYLNRR